MFKKPWLIDAQKCLFFRFRNVDAHDTSFKQQPRGYVFNVPSVLAPLHMCVLGSQVDLGTLATVGLWRRAQKREISLNHVGPQMKGNKEEKLVSILSPSMRWGEHS